ncbi:MAG: hypothetical protein QXN23_03175 [Candidatus Caldarchaeum sp.]|uniref:Uncharacterized protein n=1 Tax=Caldiarchaeum subterraneum TaxID=311458 RepID=A0A7C4E2V0_CALS0|nr:hypothetical protein [Candidatus Caldarchaeales archaeon]
MAHEKQHYIGSRGGGVKAALKDFFFGALLLGLYGEVVRLKQKYNDIFFSLVMGEFLGIPLLCNYFTLRLLPYLVPEIESARKRLLQDVDVLVLLREGPAVH